MQETLTDKRFIISKIAPVLKILLVLALLVFFIPLFILPFYNHASADDYYYGYQFYKNGFYNYQLIIYNGWSGRFSVTFLSSLFLFNHYLYSHYYLHSILFLVFNFASTFLLIKALSKYILQIKPGFNQLVLFSLIYIALTILCIPEPSTLIFWFSSTLIYYSGLILVQMEIWLCLLLYYSSNHVAKTSCFVLLPALIFVINGFSEVFVIVQFSIFCMLSFTGFFKKFTKTFLIILAISFIASMLISFFAPGDRMRSQLIPQLGFVSTVAAVLYGLMQVLLIIFKNPLLWFLLLILFFYGNYNREKFAKGFLKRARHYIRPLLFTSLFFLIISVGEGVIGLKGRIAPARFVNIVCWFMILQLSVTAFICGTIIKTKLFLYTIDKKQATIIGYTILIFCLCCNDYIVSSYKSILSAPVYDSIISERENILKNASGKKNKISVLKSYDTAFKEYMQKHHPKSSVTYYKWAQQKPELLFNDNGDSDDYSILTLKNFYNVDSVIISK